MNKRGMVKSVEDGKLEIIMTRNGACGDCSRCGGCEAEIISLKADNDINAVVGDFVEIQYNSKQMIKSTLLLYVFPLFMLLIGVIIGYNIKTLPNAQPNELLAFGVGVVMLMVSYLIIHRIDKRVKFSNYFKLKKIENLF